jgi:hypothetical protein
VDARERCHTARARSSRRFPLLLQGIGSQTLARRRMRLPENRRCPVDPASLPAALDLLQLFGTSCFFSSDATPQISAITAAEQRDISGIIVTEEHALSAPSSTNRSPPYPICSHRRRCQDPVGRNSPRAETFTRSQAGQVEFPLRSIGSCDNQLSREDIMSRTRAWGEVADRRARGNPQSQAERASHYRDYAAQFRVLADDEQSRARRARLAKLARRIAELAVRAAAKP